MTADISVSFATVRITIEARTAEEFEDWMAHVRSEVVNGLHQGSGGKRAGGSYLFTIVGEFADEAVQREDEKGMPCDSL